MKPHCTDRTRSTQMPVTPDMRLATVQLEEAGAGGEKKIMWT